jgi:chaperonin cofactor prefoldin
MSNTSSIIEELDDIIFKLKLRLIYYQTENKKLKKRIEELKKCVREK